MLESGKFYIVDDKLRAVVIPDYGDAGDEIHSERFVSGPEFYQCPTAFDSLDEANRVKNILRPDYPTKLTVISFA